MTIANTHFAMNDRAFRGHGVFDTILIKDGKAIYLGKHLERLKNHAHIMNIDIEMTEKSFNDFDIQNGAISILVTGGPAERGLKSPENPEPKIAVRIFEIPENKPIHAIIAQTTRRNEFSPLSQIKSLNYGDNILAMQEAEKQSANEAILLNTKGHVACFTTGNLFILKKGKLYTPALSDGVMNGIIRQKWIQRGNIIEKSLKPKDLEKADAIFLTNSLRGIVPVTRLNGKTVPPADFAFDPHIHHG